MDDPAPVGSTTEDITRESVSGSTGAVGGRVKNSVPVIQAFSPDATTGENRGGFVVVFSGRVFDRNTEAQIQNITVTGITGTMTLTSQHAVTVDDRAATTEPADHDAVGWKVWSGARSDGVLEFKFRQTFPAFTPAGTYTFTARATDAPGLVGASPAVVITLLPFSDITISPTPVDAAGTELPGQTWGEWSAEAGATNVAASNYLKLVNTGNVGNAAIVIDLGSAFVGLEDDTFSVPTANNLQFAWAEASGTTPPSSLAFEYLPVNSDGTVTVTFSGSQKVIYVTYRIAQLPDVLPVQSYGIAFTVTEL